MKPQIFEHFPECSFVNKYHLIVGSRPVATASVPRGLTCSVELDMGGYVVDHEAVATGRDPTWG